MMMSVRSNSNIYRRLLNLVAVAGAICCVSCSTPPIVSVEDRSWTIPVDRYVGSHVTQVTVKSFGSSLDNVTLTLEPVSVKLGSIYDGSGYFKISELNRKSPDARFFEISLAKPLYENFKIGDQFNLYIKAHDGFWNFKNEMYGEVLDPINPDFVVDDLTTSSTTRVISTTTTAAPVAVSSSSSSTAAAAAPLDAAPSSTAGPPLTENSGTDGTTFVVIIVPIVIVLPSLAVAAYFFRRRIKKAANTCCGRKKTKEDGGKREVEVVMSTQTQVTELNSRKTSLAVMSSYDSDVGSQTKEWTLTDPWEFPRHKLKIFGILGEGCFGQVWKAEAVNMDDKEASTTVAVKTLKESATEKEKKDLLQELAVMKMLEPHPNVVKLLGSCTEKDPIFVIMEYVAKGKLQEYLRKSRSDDQYYGNLHASSQKLTSRELTQFCHQVARGMDYLSSKKVIHRDLAARNILVTEDKICKVSDFGFSRDVMVNNIYERKSEGRLPIRWMAPESLYDNIYTTKTDVWSFGVLMWEIVTLGGTPYPGMSGSEVMKRVKEGHRLEKPEHCDREMYNIMYYCWDKDPTERPTFLQLVKDFENMLMKETNYIDLNQFPEHGYYNEVSLSGEKV